MQPKSPAVLVGTEISRFEVSPLMQEINRPVGIVDPSALRLKRVS